MQLEFFLGTKTLSVTPIVPILANSCFAFGDIFPEMEVNEGFYLILLIIRWKC